MKNIFILLLVLFSSLQASPQEGYNNVMKAYQQGNWNVLLNQCKSFSKEYPSSDFIGDISYYEGLAYFHLGDYDLANQKISAYLENYASEKFFEEAFAYKYEIAQKFEAGEKLHIFGYKRMPKWGFSDEETYAIYDEIIKTLPRHELAAKSLYRKGSLLFKGKDYKESVEVFQTLIRRFPKHPLTPDAYVEIAKVYLQQFKTNFADTDLIDLSEINLRNFYQAFPQDRRISEVQDILLSLRNRYAEEIWETADFFKRTKKTRAAVIYYKKLLATFPESEFARQIPDELSKMKKKKPSDEVITLIEELEREML
ncbi:MAG: outer membrane protein assembly factor BamD [Chlamydiae bacterium]|nr:outer membrane protein assembly factor BamD [Chlamydiota bacterium]